MIAVRKAFVSAPAAVAVCRVVPATSVRGRTRLRVGRRSLDTVLVDMPIVCCVQVAVVQIIDVGLMTDFRVGATRSMFVRVVIVRRMCHRRILRSLCAPGQRFATG